MPVRRIPLLLTAWFWLSRTNAIFYLPQSVLPPRTPVKKTAAPTRLNFFSGAA